MKKAYIILAHKGPAQVSRCINALRDGQSHFYLHVDKASDIESFHSLMHSDTDVQFLPRARTLWGSFAIVQAIIYGMRAVQVSGHRYSQVILMSGQDYPIKPNPEINEWCIANSDKIFMEHFELPNHAKWQPNGGMYRIDKYYAGQRMHEKFFSKSLNFLSRYVSLLKRTMYRNMTPYAGSAWWSMSQYALEYTLQFLREHPGYAAYHQYTFAPDELFFHTILKNSTDPHISGNIINSDARFIKWKDISSSHPELINEQMFPELEQSAAMFARKFDADADPFILDRLDQVRSPTQVIQ